MRYLLFLGLLVSVSCAESPTPTAPPPTPTPPPTATPTPHDPCAWKHQSFDIWSTVSEKSMNMSISTSVQYSWSEQFGVERFEHTQAHHLDSGELIGQDQVIYKAGVIYRRSNIRSDPEVFGSWWISGDYPPTFQGSAPCLDIPDPDDEGPHWVEEGEGLRSEMWVDEQGRPVRAQETFDETWEGTPHVRHYTYSGYGEENVIEAPDVPAEGR